MARPRRRGRRSAPQDGHRACLMGGVPMVAESPVQYQEDEMEMEEEREPEPELEQEEHSRSSLIVGRGRADASPHKQELVQETASPITSQFNGNPSQSNAAAKPMEIHAYRAPWASLADYAASQQQNSSIGAAELNGAAVHSPPASPTFQQIIGQVSCYSSLLIAFDFQFNSHSIGCKLNGEPANWRAA